ncbi:hypothetical protein HFO56_00425 [Rhizobium laguerreae]|uniref:hypothetical protein n=1 Tax=Rhizobium laguerreae TaxID=1076926 RepID=UPI001C91AEC7|nr:hypothetical protein [Rhizobium laguerreae]MBY3150893.1 hypothetical protein [Rhizobium laguerreae]
MSSGKECTIFENAPNEWFYALESDFGDEDAFDWRSEASAYGPFPTYDAACDHLADNHQNPGGHTMLGYDDFARERDQVTDRLVAEAAENMKRFERPLNPYRRW